MPQFMITLSALFLFLQGFGSVCAQPHGPAGKDQDNNVVINVASPTLFTVCPTRQEVNDDVENQGDKFPAFADAINHITNNQLPINQRRPLTLIVDLSTDVKLLDRIVETKIPETLRWEGVYLKLGNQTLWRQRVQIVDLIDLLGHHVNKVVANGQYYNQNVWYDASSTIACGDASCGIACCLYVNLPGHWNTEEDVLSPCCHMSLSRAGITRCMNAILEVLTWGLSGLSFFFK